VSKVLNGKARQYRIHPDTEQNVFKAAAALGYTPNYHGRSLQTGRSMCIGVVGIQVGHLTPYWGHVYAGLAKELAEAGYDLLTVVPESDTSRDAVRRALNYGAERRIDGLIVPGHHMHCFDPEQAPGWLPVIALDQDAPGASPTITSDPAPGLTETVAMLVGLGHRRFLWLGCELTSNEADEAFLQQWSTMVHQRNRQRQQIIREGAMGCQVETYIVSEPARSRAEGAGDTVTSYLPGIRKALQQHQATAILCYNDRIAVTAMAAAATLGLRVPDDVSIVGYDNLHADLTVPQLTTISPELTRMGEEAGRLVRDCIDNKNCSPRQITVPSRLILRDSTAQIAS